MGKMIKEKTQDGGVKADPRLNHNPNLETAHKAMIKISV